MNLNFTNTYSQQKYTDWFRTYFLPNDFESLSEEITTDFKTHYINKIRLLGQCESLDLSVYEITHRSEHDPRVSLSKETFRLMANLLVKNALVLFVSENSQNYRLSLTTLEFKVDNGKITKQFSNPRRYSFFLGPDCKAYTPSQCLIKKGRVKNFEDLTERFSVEVVNKKFYNEIAVLFTELVGGERKVGSKKVNMPGIMKLPNLPCDEQNHQKYQEFAVRIIGRLLFCWFLKKKSSASGIPLIDDVYLSSKAVAENYYHTVLEHLFFQVLNTPMDERANFLADCFKHTPFLNGGLFEPHEDDFYKPDRSLVSRHLNTLKVPDEWIKKLFAVFETYNFTIDENTTIDIELSIDPEMLGRIFENLLAEINPETGQTARKATGSYYTPRPIVEYMVDESLKQYLKTQTGINENRLTPLLSYSEEIELTAEEKNKIIEALEKIKVLDPACGSGAFPMGMLQKMLLILQRVDPRAEYSLQKVLRDIKDPTVRQFMKEKLTGQQDLWDYTRKLSLIQNAIYGVDIQPIAVEISKLRFFLSLIVDEQVNDNENNRGIHALPNLEFKFVAANTLIGLNEKQLTLDKPDEELINKLKRLREDYFTSYGHWKKRIEEDFQKNQKKMAYSLNTLGSTESMSFKLTQWNPFSYEAAKFFDAEWMFGIRDGFDVMIGNPPYGCTYSTNEKKFFKDNYKTAKTIKGIQKGSLDSYTLFIEKGFFRLKKNGNLHFIVPISITSSDSSTGVHRLLEANCIEIKISSYAVRPQPVFENAVVNTSILFFVKTETSCERILATKMYRKNRNFGLQQLINNLKFIDVKELKLYGRYPKISLPIERRILEKIFCLKRSIGDELNKSGIRIFDV